MDLRKLSKRALEIVRRGGVTRAFFLLAFGTGAGQVLAAICLPLISRLYTPANFGVLGLFSAVAGIIAVVAALRYETAIVIPEDDRTAAKILIAGCLTVLLSGLGLYTIIGVMFLTGHIPHVVLQIRFALWMLPLSQVGFGWQALFLNWSLRKREYKRVARIKVWQGVILVSTQVILGLLHFKAYGLIIAFVMGQAAGMTQLAASCWANDRHAFKGLTLRACLSTAIEYWKFPAFSSPAQLINAFGTNLPQIAITSLFGAGIGGAYAFATRVFMTPGTLVAQSVNQVYMVELSRSLSSHTGQPERLYRKAAAGCLAVGAGIAVLAFAAPLWFPVLFGKQWHLAATYSQIMAPALCAVIGGSPLLCFHLTGLNSWQLMWDSSRCLGLAAAIWVFGVLFADSHLVVVATTAVTCVAYSIAIWLSLIAIRHSAASRTAQLNYGMKSA